MQRKQRRPRSVAISRAASIKAWKTRKKMQAVRRETLAAKEAA
jgi:hypothetical protein